MGSSDARRRRKISWASTSDAVRMVLNSSLYWEFSRSRDVYFLFKAKETVSPSCVA